MFQNATHLPQRLDAEDYVCPNRYNQELKTCFQKGWQFLGDMSQLKRDGDFFTADLFGHPLICWRQQGKPEVFLNVCSHRLCTLTDKVKGNFENRMKCQYHGWEFDKQGNTCKIPDAVSFRPLTKDLVRLRKYPVETVGQLIFVSLEPSPPSLREFLGETMHDRCAEWFSDRYALAQNFDERVPCNWKVIMENVLESYHIATMHTKTFKREVPAEDLYHKFHPFGNELLMDYRTWGADRHLEWTINKLFKLKPTYDWRHFVRYPNIIIARSSLVTYVQAVIPESPSTCNNVFRAFSYIGERRTLRNRFAATALKIGARRFVGKVLKEDSVVYPNIQKGVSASDRPGDGLISVREERIFEFQEYLLRQLNRTDKLQIKDEAGNVAEPATASAAQD